jgi:hypothetical protein
MISKTSPLATVASSVVPAHMARVKWVPSAMAVTW